MKNMYFFDEKSFFWDWNARKKAWKLKFLAIYFAVCRKITYFAVKAKMNIN